MIFTNLSVVKKKEKRKERERERERKIHLTLEIRGNEITDA